MRLNLKLVNEELGRRGYDAELAKGRGYFFFRAGEADEWIDSTVPVRTINTLTLKKWIRRISPVKVSEYSNHAHSQVRAESEELAISLMISLMAPWTADFGATAKRHYLRR